MALSCLSTATHVSIELFLPITQMVNVVFYLIVQLNLVFGIAGLVWPDKFMPLYGMLMFPWPPSHRAIRVHGVVAIAGYLLVLARLLAFV